MPKRLSNSVLRLFGAERTEVPLVLALLAQSFLLGVPRLFTLTTANTLFLTNYGAASLPYVYISAAFVTIIVGLLYMQLQKRVPFGRLVGVTLLVLAIAQAGFIMLLTSLPDRWPSLVLLIWVEVEWTFTGIVFWSTANRLFTVRQGKRLFGLIGMGEVIAAIAGGLLTPTLAGMFGTASLLYISLGGVSLAFCSHCFIMIVYGAKFGGGESEEDDDISEPETPGGFRSLFKKKYTLLIFANISLMFVAFNFVDNAFYDQLELRYNDVDEIAGFIGTLLAAVGVLNLLAKAFVSGRWLRIFGLRGGLLGSPIVVGACAVAVVVAGNMGAAASTLFALVVMTKLAERLFAESIFQPAYITLYQPLPPGERSRAQASAETVVGEAAAGFGGVLLLVLCTYLDFTAVGICAVLLGVMAAWLVVALLASREYPKMLMAALSQNALSTTTLSTRDSRTLGILERGLESDRPEEVTYCINLLEENDHPDLEKLLLSLITHTSPIVREHVFGKFEARGTEEAFPLLVDWLEHESVSQVKGALIRAVAATGKRESFRLISPYVESEDWDVVRGTVVGLIRHCGSSGAQTAGVTLIRLQQSDDVADRVFAAKVYGEVGISSFFRGLTYLLEDPDSDVLRAALESASRLKNPELWPLAIRALSVASVRTEAVNALIMGGRAVLPELRVAYQEGGENVESQCHIVHVAGRIGGKGATKFLKSVLQDTDRTVFHDALHALQMCKYEARGEDKNIVEELLRREAEWATRILVGKTMGDHAQAAGLLGAALDDAFKKVQERLFILLSFVYPPEKISKAWDNYQDPSPETRAYALELLENTITNETVAITFPVLEDMSLENRVKRLTSIFAQPRISSSEMICQMVSAPDIWPNQWIRVCAIDILGRESSSRIVELLEPLVDHEDFRVSETALHVLSNIGSTVVEGKDEERLRRVPVIERVRILRTVRFLSDLSDDLLSEIAHDVTEHNLKEEESLFHLGDAGDSMYIVVEGSLRLFDGGRTLTAINAGEIVGEMEALVPQERSLSAVAMAPTCVLQLSHEVVASLIAERHEVARGIVQVLCHRIQSALPMSAMRHDSEKRAKPARRRVHRNIVHGRGSLSTIEKVLILKTTDMFSKAPDDTLARVARMTHETKLKKDDILFEQGEMGSTMYIIVKGKLRIHDQDQEIAVLENRGVIGEMAALTLERRSATITAMENSHLLSLTQKAVFSLMWDHIDVAQGIVAVLVERLREIIERTAVGEQV